MAKLKNKFLGEIQGKIGDVVFKQRGSTNYISFKPRKYLQSNSTAREIAKNKFKHAAKFSSAVNSIPELKYFWMNSNKNGASAYQKINKSALKTFSEGHSVNWLKMTPENGFGVIVSTYSLNKEQYDIRLEPLTERSGINTDIETNIKLITVFNPYDSSANLSEYEYFSNCSSNQIIDLNTPVEISITLSTAQTNLISMYSKCRVYNTLITLNNENVLINYANTFSSDLMIK